MESAKNPTVAHLIEKYNSGKLLVCSVGAGYVGAMTSIILAAINPTLRVVVCDISEALIKKWNDGTLPFFEPGLQENYNVSNHSPDSLFCLDSCQCQQEHHIHNRCHLERQGFRYYLHLREHPIKDRIRRKKRVKRSRYEELVS
jgi:hypothetical protein